jgi:glycine dehydrogenase
MAGMRVVVVKTDAQATSMPTSKRRQEYRDTLGALMVTYPSTHGVSRASIKTICKIVHQHGGQVYMDGANMNSGGASRRGDIGADVCHLNLHKRSAFRLAAAARRSRSGRRPPVPHLPTHPVIDVDPLAASAGTMSAGPWGSPSILPISWAYIAMMNQDGLTLAPRWRFSAPITSRAGCRKADYVFCTRDSRAGRARCIIDTRPFKASAIDVEDIAKRLIDYGFHPPTVSFPVAGTLMVEPTESEPKVELDRFVEALIAIRAEIREIETGEADRENNVLKNAPHPLADLLADTWDRPYSRERAGFPTPATRDHKVWPPVSRIDAALGDRHLICTCPPVEAYAEV